MEPLIFWFGMSSFLISALIDLSLNFTHNIKFFLDEMMMQRYVLKHSWINSKNDQFIASIFLEKKGTKLRIADFVHGTDGLGNQNFDPPEGKPIEQSAAAFLVEQAKLHAGKVTVVALGPLTNIALVRFLILWICFSRLQLVLSLMDHLLYRLSS